MVQGPKALDTFSGSVFLRRYIYRKSSEFGSSGREPCDMGLCFPGFDVGRLDLIVMGL